MKRLLFAVVSVLVCACSNDISLELPEGPPGQDGKDAYQVWVAAVEDGTIDWDEETDLSGFFRYLKGDQGGAGVAGKDAYEVWKDMVADGIEDPHNPPALWDKNKTEKTDFFLFLMGEDGAPGATGSPGTGSQGPPGPAGQSAYDLWKADVLSEEGLDNPQTPERDTWPTDRIEMAHFYEYLRGADGIQGIPGIPGLSAYDEWQKLVDDGALEWDEGTTPEDFFRFLKGKEGEPGEEGKPGIDGVDGLDGDAGKDGTDGIDGIDGRSAYDIWVEAVAAGIEDPHNPGSEWNKTKTSEKDFFYYMTGKDGAAGISAYGLWVLDVRKGIIENPHAPGTMWPDSQTTLMDFWHYLRGEDGEDGETPAPIVVPGQPGADVPPVEGMPNVIALYKDQAHSEYVSTADGSVLYQVWLASGNKAGAGVAVTDMPGIPDVTFTTLADGTIKVEKQYLPTSGTTAERYGMATVDGTTSAPNTYVPQKIDVRLMIGNSSTLMPELVTANTNELNGGAYMSVPIKAQRRITSEGEWEDLPAYMTGINRTVRAYAVDTETVASGPDPTAPNMDFMLKHRSDAAQDLRGSTVSVRRPTMPVDWMTPEVQKERYYMVQPNSTQPGYTPGMFTMVLDDDTGFYGENPHTRAVITTAPVNFHPLPAALTMSVVDATTLLWRGVSFDVNTTDLDPNDPNDPSDAERTIDKTLLFVARYVSIENPDPYRPYTLYGRGADANDNKCFAVNFGTGTTIIGGTNQASVGSPSFTFDSPTPVVVGSYVYLKPSSILIAGPGNATPIGKLREKSGGSGQYVIEAVSPLVFDDIPITIVP